MLQLQAFCYTEREKKSTNCLLPFVFKLLYFTAQIILCKINDIHIQKHGKENDANEWRILNTHESSRTHFGFVCTRERVWERESHIVFTALFFSSKIFRIFCCHAESQFQFAFTPSESVWLFVVVVVGILDVFSYNTNNSHCFVRGVIIGEFPTRFLCLY